MNVNVTITIGANDEGITDTPAEIAQKMLDALDGDPEKDICTVLINMSLSGSHGAMAEIPVP
jgi:hypothetical protein